MIWSVRSRVEEGEGERWTTFHFFSFPCARVVFVLKCWEIQCLGLRCCAKNIFFNRFLL